MNPDEMYETLISKGLDVDLDEMSFIVSLNNCKPNAIHLENEINDDKWEVKHHSSKSVKVIER